MATIIKLDVFPLFSINASAPLKDKALVCLAQHTKHVENQSRSQAKAPFRRWRLECLQSKYPESRGWCPGNRST